MGRFVFRWKNVDVEAVFFLSGLSIIALSFTLFYVFGMLGVDVLNTVSIPFYANPVFLLVVGFGLVVCKYFYEWVIVDASS